MFLEKVDENFKDKSLIITDDIILYTYNKLEYQENFNMVLIDNINLENVNNIINKLPNHKEVIVNSLFMNKSNIYNEKDISINKIKEMYPKDTTVILENMKDENMPKGLVGVVKSVDDIGQIHINWTNGSNLALNVNVDKFITLNSNNNTKKINIKDKIKQKQDIINQNKQEKPILENNKKFSNISI